MVKVSTTEERNLRRSKRLQKKLHVGAFQEFGFPYKIILKDTFNNIDDHEKVDDYIFDKIGLGGFSCVQVSNDIVVMSGVIEGYCPCEHCKKHILNDQSEREVTEETRKSYAKTLQSCDYIEKFTVGPLIDLWYDDDDLYETLDDGKTCTWEVLEGCLHDQSNSTS